MANINLGGGGGGSGDVTGPAGGTVNGDSAVFADATGKVIRAVKNNQTTIDPTVSNDNTQGYEISSRWINTVTNKEFVCVGAATGAAIWEGTTRIVISGIGAYAFDSSIVAGDPGAGEVRFNNATPGDVTELYMSDQTLAGFDATDTLSKLTTGDQIFFRNAFNTLQAALFRVTGDVTDNGAWFTIEVTPESANATFSAADLLSAEVQKVAQFPPAGFGEYEFATTASAFLATGRFGPGGNGGFSNDPSTWPQISFHINRQDGSDFVNYLSGLGPGAHIAVYDSTQNDPVPIMFRVTGSPSFAIATVADVPASYYDVTGAGPQTFVLGRNYRMVAWPAPSQNAIQFQTTHRATIAALANAGTGLNLITFTAIDGPNGADLGKVLTTFTTPYTIVDRGYSVPADSLLSSVRVAFTSVNAGTYIVQPVRIRKTLGTAAIAVTRIGAGAFVVAGAGTWEELPNNTSADVAAALLAGDEVGIQVGQLSGTVPTDFRCIFEATTLRT